MAVSLAKGQKLTLVKTGGGQLTRVVMGLGWDAVGKGFLGRRKSVDVDLDASCLLFDARGTLVDQVWFRQLRSRDGSVTHTGDNRTGEGEGDDEQIVVDLTAVPAGVQTLVFTVNSFTGQDFSQIENAFCRLLDAASPQQSEIARYDLSGSGRHNAQVMAKLARDGAGWAMTAIGATTSGRTVQDLVPAVTPHL